MQRVAPALEETAAQALFSLTVVLNRNTLAPSTNLVDGKGTLDSSIDMYNNDVGQESAQKFMKQTGALKAATLYFAS